MRFYVGDIVEIITAPFNGFSDMPEEMQKHCIEYAEPPPFRGQRFRIMYIADKQWLYTYHGKKPIFGVHVNNVKLIRRPVKNWIKYLFNKKNL